MRVISSTSTRILETHITTRVVTREGPREDLRRVDTRRRVSRVTLNHSSILTMLKINSRTIVILRRTKPVTCLANLDQLLRTIREVMVEVTATTTRLITRTTMVARTMMMTMRSSFRTLL